uniref:Uncharacterized protein n=1 Tax=Osmundaria fimbriata TaxID=228265 RepID=A0A1Z1M4Q6_OSMFI|nr:hypothetical protein [Osmundaria fimbriata]ARW60912.1 hypothetical protein [Osmundaria fimbriata]
MTCTKKVRRDKYGNIIKETDTRSLNTNQLKIYFFHHLQVQRRNKNVFVY